MKNLIRFLTPPDNWRITVIVLAGIFCGILLLVFHVSEATSYLSNRPEACTNCHVMYPHYASWSKSAHNDVATCSDCHVPQDNFVRHYLFKAKDGFRHSYAFTFRLEPQVIQIKSAGRNVVQENCIRCHLNMVDLTSLVEVTGTMAEAGEGKVCWDCHRETPHGSVRSLSAAPHALVERLPTVVPAWLQRHFGNGER
ncbi:MAG TPA: cytochrome c nitrite reductase small subunit [Bacteroidales bacterium]|nr:cytochrome c nitrite reductase small subunit [Bacteroidales bacterium]